MGSRRLAVGALIVGVFVALAIFVTYLSLGIRQTASPTQSPLGSISVTPTASTATDPSLEPTSAAPLPSTTSSEDSKQPSPGTEPQSPTLRPSTEPNPSLPTAATNPPAAGPIKLNDTSFTAPEGWFIYGDELIETDRRLVRLASTQTNIRLQVVTLKSAQADLSAACRAVVTSQAGQFTGVTEQPAVPVGVDAAKGAAATCGFKGIRTSDSLANTVTFTLLRRGTDSHVLLLRSTVPDAVPSGSPAPGQLAAMQCAAAGSFGVTLPLC